jgi:hypothetical protein
MLPDPAHAVRVKNPFVTDNRDVFRLRLCNQHPVKRVLMVTGQESGALSVFDRNGEFTEPELSHPLRELRGKNFGSRQLAQANLRGYFPSRGSGNEDIRFERRQDGMGLSGELRIAYGPPDQRTYPAGPATLFPARKFIRRERLEEGWCDLKFAFEHSSYPVIRQLRDRNQPCNRLLPSCNHDLFAPLGPFDQNGQVGSCVTNRSENHKDQLTTV